MVLAPPEAERRQLTVMMCDLVGSTALAQYLDPEDLLEVLHAYQSMGADAIQRFGGHIAQHLGDGLLVYFGYPQAHDDDAQRAVWAGLAIIEGVKPLNQRLAQAHGVHLELRVGIHTGLVVVGSLGSNDRQADLALGDAPHLANRLQAMAVPNTVVLSETTERLVGHRVTCELLDGQVLTTATQPLAVYCALGAHPGARLTSGSSRTVTPLVGREQESRLLLERWTQAREGLGQVVLISGEAGIGKSRLVQVLKDQVAEIPHIRWECRGLPYYQHTAFYPIIDLWEHALRFQREDNLETKLAKLEQAAMQYNTPLDESMPLMAALLSLPIPAGRYPPLNLTPARLKQKTLELLLRGALERAAQQPVLLIIEDLHWVDPSTLEFLTLLLDQGPSAALLLVLTCRPEFQFPWGSRTHITRLALQRLLPAQVCQLVEHLSGGKPLPPEVMQQVVNKTDGVPLFVEELTRLVLEVGFLQEEEARYTLTGPLPALAIPTTLHDSLMARLDRLATVKVVAQIGATLGRSFPYDLLQALAPFDEATLQHGLRRLVAAELLYQRGVPPQATYQFKHALIQEAAYQSLLKSTRQQYHQRIAQVVEAQFAVMAETQPELLAYHYTEAGLGTQALPYWRRAGQRALARSANAEAVWHLSKGLEVLQRLPTTPERLQEELTVLMDLGVALTITKGIAALEVANAYSRAHALCQQIGDIAKLFPVLYSLWNFYLLRADLRTAWRAAEQLATLAEREQALVFRMQAYNVQGQTQFLRGEIDVARTNLEHVIALYDLQQHRSLALVYSEDPGIDCRIYTVWVRWLLGYPDQSLCALHDAQTLAEDLAQPYSQAQVLCFGGLAYLLRRDVHSAVAWTEHLLTLCREQDFALWMAGGLCLRGGASTLQGQWEVGIAQLRQGLADWRSTGSEIWTPYFLTLLAEAYLHAGQVSAGLAAITEALAGTHRTGEHWWDAELYRLQGEGLQRQNVADDPRIETCFWHALIVARQQQAKSLELRAATSLARLWQRQGKRTEAWDLLAPVCRWFTEGFDTADLQEAKALLETLG
jgi:class 3 adenylate cyclase